MGRRRAANQPLRHEPAGAVIRTRAAVAVEEMAMPTIHPVYPVTDEGLGNTAWLVELGDRRALVVDPSRDPTPYLELARRLRLRQPRAGRPRRAGAGGACGPPGIRPPRPGRRRRTGPRRAGPASGGHARPCP